MKTIVRIIVPLIVLGLIFGAGAFAFKAGMAQGISQAPAVATAISQAAENGQPYPATPMYGYGRPYGIGHHFGFFPLGGLCFGIFFFFLFFGFLKMIFFRRMMHMRGWHGHQHGRCDKTEDGVPPMFNEWHKRAHGDAPAVDEEKKSE